MSNGRGFGGGGFGGGGFGGGGGGGGGGGKGRGMGRGTGRGGGGRGRGMGQGRGGGRGMGKCRDMPSPAGAQPPADDPRDDTRLAQVLKAQAQQIASHFGAMIRRIANLKATDVEVSALSAQAAATALQPHKRSVRMIAKVDREKCTCCGLCIDICPDQAISMNDGVVIDPSKCTGCGSCANECPNEAISMSEVMQRAAL